MGKDYSILLGYSLGVTPFLELPAFRKLTQKSELTDVKAPECEP